MAYLSKIFIYPVKSLDMVSLDSGWVLPSGALADDRRFAIVDSSGQYVNGKKNARIHLLRSSFNPNCQTLTIGKAGDDESRTFHIECEKLLLEQWLSTFFEFPVTFQENINAGFPDDTDSPGPTLVSTATLREVSDWFGFTLDQARARFRANLEVDGVPPFWEDQLFGERGTAVRFKIGGITFDGINPCQRCIVPARDHKTGQNIPDFAKRFVEMRRKRFPEWAESTRFNHFYRLAINTKLVKASAGQMLRLGDSVEIIGLIGEPETPAPVAPRKPGRWSGPLQIAGICANTEYVKTFTLMSTDGSALPFVHLPGQFLNVEMESGGAVHRRCYTISSPPNDGAYVEISVKREETGLVSKFLHDKILVGMSINVSGPGGRFTFTESDADAILLIGAGVGITPLISKIRYLISIKYPGEIRLLYTARTKSEIIFRDELEQLQRQYPNLNVIITLTQESGGDWQGERGRITTDLVKKSLPAADDYRVHICGPVQMASTVTEMLVSLNVPIDKIKSEAFGGAAPSTRQASQNEESICTATFADSGKSEPVYVGQTVLDIVSCAGVPLDRGCLEGICGRCKVRLLSGEVIMGVDEALDDTQRQEGYILACQSKPKTNIALDA